MTPVAAVIGSGPAGLFATDGLSAAGWDVDVIDALPAPYGLVRYGVAPDHLKIKSILNRMRQTFIRPGVRFLGNLTFGRDIDLAVLRRHYDAVLFATGAPSDRALGIPGEELPASRSAAEFVSWYSGHPSADPAIGELLESTRTAVIVGAGNVALDVARVLAKGAAGLSHTDVPDPVLAALRTSAVRDVHLLIRRGPAQVKFTPLELREMNSLPGVSVSVEPVPLPTDEASQQQVAQRRQLATMLGVFGQWALRPVPGRQERSVVFHFLARPVAILGTGRVRGIEVERCVLDGAGGATGTGEQRVLDAQLVIRSVGYRGAALPGLPFDEVTGTVPNEAGRVSAGVYVAGWIKRGPTGVIGTNKADAGDSVATLLGDDLPVVAHRDRDAILTELAGTDVVTWDGWSRVDSSEIDLGRRSGRERVKIADLNQLLDLARERPRD